MVATYADGCICMALLLIKVVAIVRVHLQVVKGEFLLDALLERLPLVKRERICLGNDGHDIDHV